MHLRKEVKVDSSGKRCQLVIASHKIIPSAIACGMLLLNGATKNTKSLMKRRDGNRIIDVLTSHLEMLGCLPKEDHEDVP